MAAKLSCLSVASIVLDEFGELVAVAVDAVLEPVAVPVAVAVADEAPDVAKTMPLADCVASCRGYRVCVGMRGRSSVTSSRPSTITKWGLFLDSDGGRLRAGI